MQAQTPRRLAIFTACALLLGACASSPTGRQQILLFSGSDMSQLGAQSFQELKKQEKINNDPKINQYVQCVANAITARLPPNSDFSEWEVVVFDSRQVNAFALPGGKIGVYSGLLDVAKNQDQLATVIAHEIGHVMGKKTIAEFVENSAIQEKMLEIGVDYCQGFGISHPKPLSELFDTDN